MNNLYITLEEAKKIVSILEEAHAKGFVASEAVIKMHGTIGNDGWVSVKYSHLCYKSHPTDPNLNWGCLHDLHKYAYVGENGRLYEDGTNRHLS